MGINEYENRNLNLKDAEITNYSQLIITTGL